MKKTFQILLYSSISLFAFVLTAHSQQKNPGVFDENGVVGNPILKGDVVYNNEDQTYFLSGAGKNIWTKIDQFQFTWKKIKGDFIIKATVQFIGKGVASHRKTKLAGVY